MTDWAGNSFAIGYNASGDQSSISINGGDVSTSTGYDGDNGISSIQTTAAHGATNLLSFAYTRQANGEITSSTPTVSATVMAKDSYGYNSASQVSSGPITGASGNSDYA